MNRLSRLALAAAGLLLTNCAKDEAAVPTAPPSSAAPQPLPPMATPKEAAPARVTTAEEIAAPAIEVSSTPGSIAKGKELFSDKGCVTCHLSVGGVKALGPELKGVFTRRTPLFVERMILRPDVMIRTDPTAKQLFAQYSVPMTNQRVDADTELPFLLAYIKSLDQ